MTDGPRYRLPTKAERDERHLRELQARIAARERKLKSEALARGDVPK